MNEFLNSSIFYDIMRNPTTSSENQSLYVPIKVVRRKTNDPNYVLHLDGDMEEAINTICNVDLNGRIQCSPL